MIEYNQITTTSYTLTQEGSSIASSGSHEYRVWQVLPAKGQEPITVQDIKVSSVERPLLASRCKLSDNSEIGWR
jgi:hypothetical protein